MLRFIWFALLRAFGRDHRGIFWFWDGRRWQGVDPLPAARLLLTDPDFSWEQTATLTDDEDSATQAEAIGICAAAARRAFGIKSYEESGLTETECCRVLWFFGTYLGSLKKNGSGQPISPEPSEPGPSDESAMNAVSGSGSTVTESLCSDPGKSPRESPPADPME